MNPNLSQANRAAEIAQEIADLLGEFKQIARDTMTASEYQQFKYRTLGHIEPAVSKETEWVTRYSSLDSLEEVAENMMDYAQGDDDEDFDDPSPSDED